MSKLVVVVQCHLVMSRCSGYNCMNAFYQREGKFAEYAADTRYMTITCGGCCGAQLAAKLEQLLRRLRSHGERQEDVIIHLAACVCSDNYHRPPCPHLDYLKEIIRRKGYKVVSGSYISKTTSDKREQGVYCSY